MGPVVFLYRAVNTISTGIVVGKVAWNAYKKYSKMKEDKERADEVRKRFTKEFVEQFGREPTDQEIDVVLKTMS